MKDYYKSTLLPAEYYAFVAFVGLPRGLRVPASEAEFLQRLGVGKNQGYVWRHLPNFKEDVLRASMTWALEMNADVFGAVYIAAVKDRNPYSQRIWLEHIMKIAAKIEHKDDPTEEKTSLTALLMERYQQRPTFKAQQQKENATRNPDNTNRESRD